MYALSAQRCEGKKFIVTKLTVKDVGITRSYLFDQQATRLSTLELAGVGKVQGQFHVIGFPNFYFVGAITDKAIYNRPLYEQRNVFFYLIIEC
ncbi:hypothetical protein C7A11_04865 [Pseudomonas simiae]|nr:hypothetical protein C7A11_04865 [Pseudomonas simiae]TKK00884.1 hypothetical protein PflCFBP13514_24755 [Pseudomonas fluorescens]